MAAPVRVGFRASPPILGLPRAHLLAQCDLALEAGQRQQRERAEGQASFFDLLPAPAPAPRAGEPAAAIVKQKPAWEEALRLRTNAESRVLLDAIHAGSQEEIRLRACMMAAVDEGVGMLLEALEKTRQLEDTLILFLGDNGYFFGEHGLGPERRFPYEEGIRAPFIARYPKRIEAGTRVRKLVICQDIAPTLTALAGGRPGPHIQGRSLLPLLAGKRDGWRKSFLMEYWAENAYPWLVGMTYKAVRTEGHKYIRWVNRSRDGELDELYDLERDPYEIANVIERPAYRATRDRLRRELRRLAVEAAGL